MLQLFTANGITGTDFGWPSLVPSESVTATYWREDWQSWVPGSVRATGASGILIDSLFDPADETHIARLRQLKLTALRVALADENQLPGSLRLLVMLCAAVGDRIPVVYCVDDPSIALVQELLRIGTAWVCPQRRLDADFIVLLEELKRDKHGIAVERSDTDVKLPRVLVVEDSRAEWDRIRVELAGLCTLEFVGENRPGTHFRVSLKDVEAQLGAGPFDGAIVDLSLSRSAEAEARQRFQTDRDIQSFISGSGLPEAITIAKEIFVGLETVRLLRRRISGVPIAIMSNYARTATAVDLFFHAIGPDAKEGLDMFAKTEDDYVELHRWAMSLRANRAYLDGGRSEK